ncbi:MAG: cytidylate kinase-like family protein [Desulfobacterales bacterium]|nr:cytidylate kinase-like family protein [Desulfobacterales bacterium]
MAGDVPAIAIITDEYAASGLMIEALKKTLGCSVYSDHDILGMTHREHGLKKDLLSKVTRGKSIPFNNFTHDREKCLSGLKKTLSNLLIADNCILVGIISHLIPASVTHVFRIQVSASRAVRIRRAVETGRYSENTALSAIEKADRDAARWIKSLPHLSSCDPPPCDLVIPSDDQPDSRMDVLQADEWAGQVRRLLEDAPFAPPPPRAQELFDFRIDADAALALASIGSGFLVHSTMGNVTVTLDRKVMNLVQIQQEIIETVSAISGVRSVKTKIGPNYYQGNLVRSLDFGRFSRNRGDNRKKEQ